MVATTCPGSIVSPSFASTVFRRPAYFAAMSTWVASSRPFPAAKPGGSFGLESSHHATPPPTTATAATMRTTVFLDIVFHPSGHEIATGTTAATLPAETQGLYCP